MRRERCWGEGKRDLQGIAAVLLWWHPSRHPRHVHGKWRWLTSPANSFLRSCSYFAMSRAPFCRKGDSTGHGPGSRRRRWSGPRNGKQVACRRHLQSMRRLPKLGRTDECRVRRRIVEYEYLLSSEERVSKGDVKFRAVCRNLRSDFSSSSSA